MHPYLPQPQSRKTAALGTSALTCLVRFESCNYACALVTLGGANTISHTNLVAYDNL